MRTEGPGLREALVVGVCTIASANSHEEADPTTVGQALASLPATTKSGLLRDVEALTRLARRAGMEAPALTAVVPEIAKCTEARLGSGRR